MIDQPLINKTNNIFCRFTSFVYPQYNKNIKKDNFTKKN